MTSNAPVVPRNLLLTFAMVTGLFALWGFANDITNPMVAAFKNVLLLSNFQSSLVQAAFYGGYCLMAIPAALFIRKYSYKRGVLTGLALYAAGCALFIPSGLAKSFSFFLFSYLILTCGLSFLETSSNPFILSLGDPSTATRRLNIAQAFNPCGSILGMIVASEIILKHLDPMDEEGRRALASADPAKFDALQHSDLVTIVIPYAVLGIAVLAIFAAFLMIRMSEASGEGRNGGTLDSLKRLFSTPRYVGGVVAQFFYVGVQIMCWTFIIQYAGNELGISKAAAQRWNIVAMVMFVSSRFVCTWLMKYINAGRLLGIAAVGGGCAVLGTVFLHGMPGLLSLVCVSMFMSLMFPTIYGLALDGLGDDAKLGSAGLIFVIGGGALFPPLQALIMDGNGVCGISATRVSFFLPLLCFVVIAAYGFACSRARSLPAR